ncbi:hypothetical protein AB0L68_11690 [Streptomyces sp. NPDC052164]|uniref:hypothetical protein n=1 Tax=Streptomyces sp. NPDC052164 TaxID=3155529 RepID=UPI00342DE346
MATLTVRARRAPLTGADGAWAGLLLDVDGRPTPALGVRTAERRMLLTQGPDPLLFAAVTPDHCGVDFYRTDGFRPVLPPLRAETARRYGGSARRWAYHFADGLVDTACGPLHHGRWVLGREAASHHWNRWSRPPGEYWRSLLIEGHPSGEIDWFVHNGSWELLPLRALPEADDARVKAYRKQAREGILPPVLLWWVSGLDCFAVLDGHARLAAALAESVEPTLLDLHRTVPQDEKDSGTAAAVAAYESELERFSWLRERMGPGRGSRVPDGARVAGPLLATRLRELHSARRPTWAWPLPGGTAEWRRLLRDHRAGGDHEQG